MKKNLGTIDRVIRVILALVIILLYALNVISGGVGLTLLIISGVVLLTGIFGVCPLYIPLGLNSGAKK
jgi:hypothetical protein